MIYLPHVYQEEMRTFGLEVERGNLFAGMGLGKTAASLDLFESARIFGEAKRAVVFAPKLVAEVSWPDEMEKWKESFGHLKMAACVGTVDQRLAALRSRPDILTVNYEMVEWLIAQYGDHWPYDMVFADESTRLKGLRISLQTSKLGNEFVNGQGSKRAKALAKIAHTKVRRWINLSGSPAPNGVEDLWGQHYFVDKGKALGTSFGAFHERWYESHMEDRRPVWTPKAGSKEEIEALIRPKSLAVDAKDYFDIADPIEKTIFVRLPPGVRKKYDEMQRDFFTEIEHGSINLEVEAVNGGSKLNKLRQIASGFIFHDKDAWVHLHDQKVEALKSVVEEAAGASVLVGIQYKPELERILKAFPKARYLRTKADIRAFQDGSLRVGVAHPASVGHGHNLQDNCWIMCDYTTGWNLELDEQILERIGPTRQAQSGHKRAVWRIRIVAQDTVEQTMVVPRIKTKSSVQDSVRAAMKRGFSHTLRH